VLNRPPPPAADRAAPRVGDYRLLGRIGEGGMGVVHLAQAPDGRRVALKVLRQHVIGDEEARARLAREVASLRRVTSPRIAEVVDADPWGPTPFVATRYVPGPSLHEHVRRTGPITGPDLVHFAAGLAEAVIAVHRVGVLHRDIKPSNVLLEGRSPVLIDFGLARLAEDPRLTQTGWLLGTPGYLAPEILYGDDATTASDVHSWAATVVFAATGRPPFGTGPSMAIMDRVRRGEHDLSAVPPGLLPLLRDCLAPEPADRPSTAVVMARLRPAPTEQPTLAFPSTGRDSPTAQRTRPFTRPPTSQPTAQPAAQPVPQSFPAPPPAPVRSLRALLPLGLFASVTSAFAAAPYVALVGLAAVALLVRTLSWTTESARERQHLRGRRRWYDGVLTVLTVPWYLVVATAGTLVLLLWAACAAFAAGFAYLLFRGPLVPGLLLMGAVLSLSLWWGPGSRRLRTPTRRLVRAAARRPWLGWSLVTVLAATAVVCLSALSANGVLWEPSAGPPWRADTLLGDLLRWF